MSGTVGGLAIMVAVFVVAGTFALAIQQRTREIGLLRAVAATPRQVRWMLAGEALVVGLAAAAAGAGPGAGVAVWLRWVLVGHSVLPASFKLYVGTLPMLAATAAAIITAELAVLASARRAAKIRPVEAITEASVEPRKLGMPRVILGTLFLAGGITVLAVSLAGNSSGAVNAAPAVVMMLMVALALLGPTAARLASGAAGVVLARTSRVGGFLAIATARANSRRLASAITPLALTVALTCTVAFIQTTLVRAADQQARVGLRANLVLQPTLGPGLPPGAVAAAEASPGVAAATGIIQTTVLGAARLPGNQHLTSDTFAAQAVTLPGLTGTVNLGVTSGHITSLSGHTAALSKALAGQLRAHVGSKVKLWLGDRTTVTVHVVAVYARGLGYGDVTLPMPLAAAHVTNPLDSLVLVRMSASADPRTVGLGLQRRLSGRYAGITGLSRDGFEARQRKLLQLSTWLNYLVLAVIFLFTAIAVVNTLVMATAERSREFALLRLCGATRRQILTMMRWEALLVTAISAGLGTAIAAGTLIVVSLAVTGSPVPVVPPLGYAAVVSSCALLALAATQLTARAGLRLRPAGAITAGR